MFLGKNIHLRSELTKSLSSVRPPGVVTFRSRVKGQVNIFGVYLTLNFFLTQPV